MLIILFFLTAAISFAGSLQAGPVNTYLLHISTKVDSRRRAGLALAGSIPEVLYAAASVYLANMFAAEAAGFWFDSITSLVLIGVGVGLVRYKPKEVTAGQNTKPAEMLWLRTLALGLANPQLLVFWSANAAFLISLGLFKDGYSYLLAFSLGAGAGAFVLLSMVLRLGKRIERVAGPHMLERINKGLGWLLLVVGMARLAWMFLQPFV